MKKIAINGSFSTGKTTLANHLPVQNKITSLERELAQVLELDFNTVSKETFTNYQFQLFHEVIRREKKLWNFVTDQSIFTCLAYSRDTPIQKELIQIAESYLTENAYHLIIHLTNELNIVDDWIRLTDPKLRIQIEKRLKKLYEHFDVKPIIITGPLEQRVDSVMKLVNLL